MDKSRSIYVAIIFIVATICFITDIFYFNYDFIHQLGFTNSWMYDKLVKLNGKFLLRSPFLLRAFTLVVLAFSIFISKVKMKITEKEKRKSTLVPLTIFLAIAYIFTNVVYQVMGYTKLAFVVYLVFTVLLYLNLIYFLSAIHKMYFSNLMKDRFTKDGRKFKQFKEYLENEYSINIQTEDGWINIVNPFRASQVLGTPGSGKSYSFLIAAIIQMVSKGFAMLVYDYKFPDLSLITYNALNKYHKSYEVVPQFCIINFDNLRKSNRCNPLQPELLYDTTDATESAKALMYGLYPKWSQKQGEFFTESSINFVAACIWALKKIADGQYCSVPHLIQFIALDYNDMFKILTELDDDFVNNVISPFISAYNNQSFDQLEGQVGTTRIALSRLTSPFVYWVMTDDFEKIEKKDSDNNIITDAYGNIQYEYVSKSGHSISLQINDPKNPKILCLANNPDKQSVYGPLLSLYNTRLMKLINKKNMLKTGVFFDELPTLSFPPGTIDNLIATARSNKIAVFLGYQDFAQLIRDLGKEIAEAIINTVGNTFSGMVNFDTAKKLSEKFGKIKIKKESLSLSKESTSVSVSTEMQDLIPPSEISSLPQGVFVGQVADDRGYEIEQKIFYSKVIIDHEKRKEFEKGEIPDFVEFNESVDITIKKHFNSIKEDIQMLVDTFAGIID